MDQPADRQLLDNLGRRLHELEALLQKDPEEGRIAVEAFIEVCDEQLEANRLRLENFPRQEVFERARGVIAEYKQRAQMMLNSLASGESA